MATRPNQVLCTAAFFLLCVSSASMVVAQLPKPVDKPEREAFERMARVWSELAALSAEKGAPEAAKIALAEAEACGFAGPEHDLLAAKVAAAEGDGSAPEVKSRDQSVRQRVAAILDDLTKRAAADAERAEAFFFEALRVQPGDKKRCAALQAKATAAATAKDRRTAARLLKRAPEADPEGHKAGKYLVPETALGKEDLLLVKAPGHVLEAYVSLPKEWSATSKTPWPVVVAFDGASSSFATRAADLKKAGEKRPYVVVVPCSFSNANVLEPGKYPSYPPELVEKMKPMETRAERLAWEVDGMKSLLPELRRRFRLEERVYITGYSGGGMPTYAWLAAKPEEIAAACPVSANFYPNLLKDPVTPEDGGPPVLLITGENDGAKERIFPQSEEAVAYLKGRGFKTVDRNHLKGRGHEAFPDLCLDFFDQVRKRKSK